MGALIVYGSLINESELVQGGFPLQSTYPIIVQRFKRIFSQEPSWRRSDQVKERAVLNIVGSKQHWLNGLLISGLEDDFFTDLERVMDLRREYRLPDGERGKRRRQSATPPKRWVASRNP